MGKYKYNYHVFSHEKAVQHDKFQICQIGVLAVRCYLQIIVLLLLTVVFFLPSARRGSKANNMYLPYLCVKIDRLKWHSPLIRRDLT